MSLIQPTVEVVDLTIDKLEEATGVLASAFYNDPLANYLMADLGDDFPGCLSEFFRFTCEIRLDLGSPFLGVVRDGRFAGSFSTALALALFSR